METFTTTIELTQEDLGAIQGGSHDDGSGSDLLSQLLGPLIFNPVPEVSPTNI